MTFDPERYDEVHRIFDQVRALDGNLRATRLEELCGQDAALREEVESLLIAVEDSARHPFGDTAIAAFRGSLEDLARDPSDSPPDVVGRYRVLDRLGEGGMAVVYRAEQDSPRRTVALKLLRADDESLQRIQRFRQETEILGRLHHPGIAQIFEAGFWSQGAQNRPYFAMEIVDGVPLTQYAREKDLPVTARLELLAQVCDAVHYAHGEGVIHRDLKPDNILVNSEGRAKVLDFGIARVIESSDDRRTRLTADGDLLGTLAYMAPEQLEGTPRKMTPAVDVHALGVIAFELLSGRLPVDLAGLLIAAAIQHRRETVPPPLSRVRPELRGDVESIVAKALDDQPTRRYPTAAALADDVRAYLSNRPIAARPPSRFYKAVKFGRRHRGLMLGVSATLAVSLIGFVVSLFYALRATVNERQAVDNGRLARAGMLQATQDRLDQGDLQTALTYWHRLGSTREVDQDAFEERLIRAVIPETIPGEFGRGSLRWIDSNRILCARGTSLFVLERGSWKVLHRIPMEVACRLPHNDSSIQSIDRSTLFWVDVDAGKIVHRFESEGGRRLGAAGVMLENNRFVGARLEGRSWQLYDNEVPTCALTPDPEEGAELRFSPDGRRIVAATSNGWRAVYDVSTGQRLAERRGLRASSCMVQQFDAASTTIVAYETTNRIALLDLETLKTKSSYVVPDPGCGRGQLSPDGSHFAIDDGTGVLVMNLVTNESTRLDHPHDKRQGVRVEWCPDGVTLLIKSLDRSATLMNVTQGGLASDALLTGRDPRFIAFGEHPNWVQDFAISHDGRMVASVAVPDPWLRVWDVDTGETIARLPRPEGVPGYIGWDCGMMVAFSADGKRLASTYRSLDSISGIQLWDVIEGRAVEPQLPRQLTNASHLELIDAFLGVLGPTPRMRLGRTAFRKKNGRVLAAQIPRLPRVKPGTLWSAVPWTNRDAGLSLSPNESQVALAASRQVLVHDMESWEVLLDVPVPVTCVSWCPDGRLVAAGTMGGFVHLIDVEQGIEVIKFRASNSGLYAVDWTPDGTRLVTAGSHAPIRVWHPLPGDAYRAKRIAYERALEGARLLGTTDLNAALAAAGTIEERMLFMRVALERRPGAPAQRKSGN